MIRLPAIAKKLGEYKNAIVVVSFLVTSGLSAGKWTVNYIADEVVHRSNETRLKIYRINRAQDSIRFDMAADLAAKVLFKQDSMTFVLQSINLWQKDIDRKIGQIAKKITTDTTQNVYQRELAEIRRLIETEAVAAEKQQETEEAMRRFIKNSIQEIQNIKKGDRAQ